MQSRESSKEKAGHAKKTKTLDPELIDNPRQTRNRCPMAQYDAQGLGPTRCLFNGGLVDTFPWGCEFLRCPERK